MKTQTLKMVTDRNGNIIIKLYSLTFGDKHSSFEPFTEYWIFEDLNGIDDNYQIDDWKSDAVKTFYDIIKTAKAEGYIRAKDISIHKVANKLTHVEC